MKPTLVDTDILSMYFRGAERVEERFEKYFEEYGKINISIITYYEIASGLEYKDAKKQLEAFLEFARQNTVLPPHSRFSNNISRDICTITQSGTTIG